MAAAYKLASMALGFVSRMRRKALGPRFGEWVSQASPDRFFTRRLSLAPTIHRSRRQELQRRASGSLGRRPHRTAVYEDIACGGRHQGLPSVRVEIIPDGVIGLRAADICPLGDGLERGNRKEATARGRTSRCAALGNLVVSSRCHIP